jgi:very-short-patch-repair endonuclease
MAFLNRGEFRYWLELGYSQETARSKASEHRALFSPGCSIFWIRRNIKDLSHLFSGASCKYKKKHLREVEFWKSAGLDPEEHISKIKNCANCYNREYWKVLGYSSDVLIDKEIEKQKGERCSLSKEYIIRHKGEEYYKELKSKDHRKKENKSNTVLYYTSRGYSEKEAKKKISQRVRKASSRCVQHWLAKGYSEEDAGILVKNFQDNTSIESFVKKYGVERGKEAYSNYIEKLKNSSERSVKYWLNKGYSEQAARDRVSEIQSKNALNQKKCAAHWLSKGYSLKESKERALAHARIGWVGCADYWLFRGYSLEESVRMSSQRQKELSSRVKKYNQSSYEKKIFEFLCEYHPLLIQQKYFYIEEVDKSYCVDFYVPDKNMIIEFHGDYFHMNPSKYSESDTMYGTPFSAVRKKNEERERALSSLGNLIIIWESEYNDADDKLKLFKDKGIL